MGRIDLLLTLQCSITINYNVIQLIILYIHTLIKYCYKYNTKIKIQLCVTSSLFIHLSKLGSEHKVRQGYSANGANRVRDLAQGLNSANLAVLGLEYLDTQLLMNTLSKHRLAIP